MIQKLFGFSGVRDGEGKKTIMLGPDPGSFRIIGAERDGHFDFIEATITYLQGPLAPAS